MLAVSRALGDCVLKPIVSCVPFTTSHTRTLTKTPTPNPNPNPNQTMRGFDDVKKQQLVATA